MVYTTLIFILPISMFVKTLYNISYLFFNLIRKIHQQIFIALQLHLKILQILSLRIFNYILIKIIFYMSKYKQMFIFINSLTIKKLSS